MTDKFKIKTIEGRETIFDIIRKKYVSLTPEEWVRQHFLQYVIHEKKYPPSLISVEKRIKIGGVSKRFDILIYKNAIPWMLVECKSESLDINDNSLGQILAYNSALKVKYLTFTNGKNIHCFDIANHIWSNELPSF